MKTANSDLQDRTIADFGEQWTAFTDNEGFYASADLFDDAMWPFVRAAELAGKRVAEIGAGTGRFINVFGAAGAAHIVALEPSNAFDVLRTNTQRFASEITYVRAPGDRLPASGDLDWIFSIGVLHHIPSPDPVVRAALAALRPGGRIGVWVYGREGNGLYLACARALWVVSRRLPHAALTALARGLDLPLAFYAAACRRLPLPLAPYMRRVIARLTPAQRRLVIYDQLNPAYAKYYSRQEAVDLLERNGFARVQVHHRHRYSWTVVGEKE